MKTALLSSLVLGIGVHAQMLTSAIPQPTEPCTNTSAYASWARVVANGIAVESAKLANSTESIMINAQLSQNLLNAHRINAVLFKCGWGPDIDTFTFSVPAPQSTALSEIIGTEIPNYTNSIKSYIDQLNSSETDRLSALYLASQIAFNLGQDMAGYVRFPGSVTKE